MALVTRTATEWNGPGKGEALTGEDHDSNLKHLVDALGAKQARIATGAVPPVDPEIGTIWLDMSGV